MAEHAPVCTACFPTNTRPQCRVFEESCGALTIYSGLHATGQAPAMCQGHDGRFRVCHQPSACAAPAASPGGRQLHSRAA